MSTLVRSSFALLVLALLTAVGWPSTATAAARDIEVTGVVNLNTATESELRQLPGIGPAKAQRILELRAKRKFDNTEQLMRVKGIGRKTYRKLKPNLAVAGATTIQRQGKAGGARVPRTEELSGQRAEAAADRESTPQAAPAPRPATARTPPAATPKRPVTAHSAE